MKAKWTKRLISTLMALLLIAGGALIMNVPASAATAFSGLVCRTNTNPNVTYALTYTQSRPSNTQMTYNFTLAAAISTGGYFDGYYANNNLTATVTVGGVSRTFDVKKGADAWRHSSEPTRTFNFSITCASSTGNASQSGSFKVTSNAYTGGTTASDKTFTVTSSALLPTTLTINPNGGSVSPTTKSQVPGTTYALPTPTLTGNLLSSWSLSGGGSLSGNTYTFGASNGTVKANWKANTLSVSYHANNGSITSDTYKLSSSLVYLVSDSTKYVQSWTYNSAKENGLTNASTFGLFRTGYTFSGWGTTSSGGTIFDQNDGTLTPLAINSSLATQNCSSTLYAIWKANTNTVYKVERYYQAANGTYPSAESVSETKNDGTTAASKTITPPTVTNYTYDGTVTGSTGLTLTIAANGSTVFKLYYKRNLVNLTVNKNGGTGGSDSQTGLRWGSTVTLTPPTQQGYTFANWSVSGTGASVSGNTVTLGTTNTTVTANWTPNTNTAYKIERYYQAANGTYPSAVSASETKNDGTTAASKTITAPTVVNYTYDGTAAGSSGLTLTIAANGSTVFKLYYKRSLVNLTVNKNGGTGGSDSQTGLRWGSTVTLTPPTQQGYTFANWSVSGTGASVSGNTVTLGTANTTVTANWTPNTNTAYKIERYDQNADGTYPASASVTETKNDGTTAASKTITAPTVVNYTYDGTAAGSSGLTLTIAANGSTVFKLYYKRNLVNLTVDKNGGTGGSNSQTELRWGSTVALTPPTQQGYAFASWTVSGTGASISGNTVTLGTANTTVKANWTPNSNTPYKIERYYQNADGTYPASASITETQNDGTTAASKTITAPAVTNYAYDGTVAGSTGLTLTIAANGSTTFRLYYKRSTFSLTVNKNGGTGGTDSQSGLRWGQQISLANPTKEGHAFTTWVVTDPGPSISGSILTMGTANATITAVWKINQYTLTIDIAGAKTTVTQDYGTTYILPNLPTREGYAFSDWTLSGSGSLNGNIYTFGAGNGTVTAGWIPSPHTQYKVETYLQNADGTYPAAASASETKSDGTTAASKTITAPAIANYTYDGTLSGSTGLTLTIEANGSTVYKLYYRRNLVNLTVNKDGGTGGTDSQANLRWGQQVMLIPPTKASCEFAGWTVAGAGASISGSTLTMGTADTTITAQWNRAAYTISYDPNGGNGTMPNQAAVYDEYVTLTTNTFTYTGYVFTGWNTAADGTGTSYSDRQVFTPWKLTNDLKLYARWMSLNQVLRATIPDAPEFLDPIIVEYPPEAQLDNVQLNVDLLRDEKRYEILGFAYATPVFDINLTKNGIPIQPAVKVVVRIPDPFEDDEIPQIFRVSDDGTTREDMHAVRVIYDGKRYLEFITDHFSYYALVNPNSNTTNPGNPTATVRLNTTSLLLEYKANARLTATVSGSSQPVQWNSSNTSLVTVDQNGNVQSVKSFWKTGSAVITAKCGSATATCTVRVSPSFIQWIMIIFLFGWIWM